MEKAIRERDALRYVASLAAAAAHEINNPLAVIMGQAQLLQRAVDPEARRRIDEILEAIRRIEAIVVRLKQINRLELAEAPPHLPGDARSREVELGLLGRQKLMIRGHDGNERERND
jgi:signal transduction histidine kinase